MAALPQPLSVALPTQPNDPRVPLPAAPVFPPTVNNVLEAVRYRRDVETSLSAHSLHDDRCTSDDHYNAIIYEHSVIAQAAAAAANPQAAAPPWFQGMIHQFRVDLQNDLREFRADFLNDLKQFRNDFHADLQNNLKQFRVDIRNDLMQLCLDPRNNARDEMQAQILRDLRSINNRRLDRAIVPFEVVPFNDGTNPSEAPNNLPILRSVNDIEKLTEQQLVAYLTGYGVDPLHSTKSDRWQKETLKELIGATRFR